MPRAGLMYVKGQHLLWMVSERVILSVKRTNSKSKGKRLEVGWEAVSLSLRNFPRIPSAFTFLWAGEGLLAVRQKD